MGILAKLSFIWERNLFIGEHTTLHLNFVCVWWGTDCVAWVWAGGWVANKITAVTMIKTEVEITIQQMEIPHRISGMFISLNILLWFSCELP